MIHFHPTIHKNSENQAPEPIPSKQGSFLGKVVKIITWIPQKFVQLIKKIFQSKKREQNKVETHEPLKVKEGESSKIPSKAPPSKITPPSVPKKIPSNKQSSSPKNQQGKEGEINKTPSKIPSSNIAPPAPQIFKNLPPKIPSPKPSSPVKNQQGNPINPLNTVVPLHANCTLTFDLVSAKKNLKPEEFQKISALVKEMTWVLNLMKDHPKEFSVSLANFSHIKGNIKIEFCQPEKAPTGAQWNGAFRIISLSTKILQPNPNISSYLYFLFFELGNASQNEKFSKTKSFMYPTPGSYAKAVESIEYDTEKVTFSNLTELYDFLKKNHPKSLNSLFHYKPQRQFKSFAHMWQNVNIKKFLPGQIAPKAHADFYRDYWQKTAFKPLFA